MIGTKTWRRKRPSKQKPARLRICPPPIKKAVSRALELMIELSDAARDANTQAYEAIKGQVDQALKDLKA